MVALTGVVARAWHSKGKKLRDGSEGTDTVVISGHFADGTAMRDLTQGIKELREQIASGQVDRANEARQAASTSSNSLSKLEELCRQVGTIKDHIMR